MRSPGRPKAGTEPATDDRVLTAAIKAFARQGYDGVSIRTLSRELGVSHNTIPQRFGSKEKLWYAAVDRAFGRIVDDLAEVTGDEAADPMELIHAGIVRFIQVAARAPELHGLITVESANNSERLDYIFDTYISPAVAPLARALDTLAAAGRIRPTPLRTFYFLIATGGAGPFALAPLAGRFAGEAGPVDEHARLVADILTAGIRSPSPLTS